MERLHYKDLKGLENLRTSVIAPQVSFLKLDNHLVNDEIGALVKRGGSSSYDVTGSLYGYAAVPKEGANHRDPVTDIILRHRRQGSTSYIEVLDWSTDSWSAATLGSFASLNVGDIMGYTNIGGLCILAADRVHKITDIDTPVVERLGGAGPSSAPSVAAGAAGNLTGSYRWYITFYDSTSGWESNPSPVSSTVALTAEQCDLSSLPTAAFRENVDKKRIYRTIGTNEEPFLFVAEIPLAQTTYSDNIADASLGDAGPIDGDRDAAPESSYVVAGFKERAWVASGRYLYHSQADDGTGIPLEYFSNERRNLLPQKITALKPNRNGGMYIFCPPGYGIYEVVGNFENDDDFQIVPVYPKEGTHFHTSVCNGGINDDEIHFFGRSGSTIITPSGLRRQNTRLVDNAFRGSAIKDWGGDMYCWAFWDSVYSKYIVGLILYSDPAAAIWQDSQSAAEASWAEVGSGAMVGWEVA